MLDEDYVLHVIQTSQGLSERGSCVLSGWVYPCKVLLTKEVCSDKGTELVGGIVKEYSH